MSVVSHRRALHRIPELGDQLPETLRYVRAALAPLPCQVSSPIPGSVCAWFDAGKPEAVAFRADLDALPMRETTGVPYASTHPGVMHACGHDGHTAMALALAEYVSAHLAELPRNVLFLFQPAEEAIGGAERLCRTGILDQFRVYRVFGLHLWPGLDAGKVFSRPGPLMARSSEVTVTITGKSVHLARYEQGRDALMAGVSYLQQSIAITEQPSALLHFGKMTSGTMRNAVSGETLLEGSLRAFSEQTFLTCRQRLEALGWTIAAETGCGVEVQLSEGYPAVQNAPKLYEKICRQLGPDAPLPLDQPVLMSEDFSCYQRRVPGVFFFLGVGNTAELHAPDFDFDDETILPKGVAFLQKLLLES